MRKAITAFMVVLSLIILGACQTARQETSSVEGKEVNVAFTKSETFVADFSVMGLKAKRVGDEIEFTLNCKSDTQRAFSFFDPPEGAVIMYTNELPAGSSEMKFSILLDDLKQCKNITMKFAPWDSRSFIFLNMYDLKRVMR